MNKIIKKGLLGIVFGCGALSSCIAAERMPEYTEVDKVDNRLQTRMEQVRQQKIKDLVHYASATCRARVANLQANGVPISEIAGKISEFRREFWREFNTFRDRQDIDTLVDRIF